MTATTTPTPADMIAHWESTGFIAPDCPTCRAEVYAVAHEKLTANPQWMPWMPRHTASPRCRSNKRAHCSCNTCF